MKYMLFIEIAKLVLTGGHTGIMLFIEIENLVFPGGHIEIMLFIETTRLELSVGL